MYRKNVANQYIYFALVNTSTGLGLTGASVTAYRALDNGAQATATGTTSELGNGQYRFNLSQADTNADEGSYLFIASGASPVEKTVVFTAANPSDGAAFGLSKFADIETDTQDIQTRIPSGLVDGRMAAIAQVVGDKTGYKLASDGLSLVTQWAVAITGNITGNVTGSVGSISGVTFPENFALLGIDGSGAISEVILVYELDAGALTANSAGDPIAGYVWNALTTTAWPSNSFGKTVLVSGSTNRVIKVTGSGAGHVAADLHESQAGSIHETTFDTDAWSARVLASDAATEIATAVAGTQALSRLDSMIESDGAGQFRFDTIALSMAPAGGGGGGGTDWTANERTAIKSILGIPTSGTTPTDPTEGILDEIRDQTALIQAGGTVNVSTPVTASGQLASPLIIGDDYLAANGRGFRWTVPLPPGFVIATSTCRFGMRYEDDQGVNSFIKTGTVSDAGSGNVHLDFDLSKAVETGLLRPGWYDWSVEIVSASGTEITRVKSGKNAEWQEKQT
ncbi:MAG: hypothetical protein RLZZ396_1906 [Planctomycetota bacterium]|jgi:hypothetical protein